MSFIQSSTSNFVAILIRISTGLALNKIAAIYLGPSGYAAMGQFQSILNVGSVLASGGLNTGLIRYTAEYEDCGESQKKIWRSAFLISTACALTTALFIFFFCQELSAYVLKNENHADLLIGLSGLMVFITWTGLLLSILNGLKQLPKFIAINIMGNVIGLALASTLTIFFGFRGAIISLLGQQALIFLLAFVVCRKTVWFRMQNFFGKFDKKSTVKLLKFAAMGSVSALVAHGANFFIRNHLVEYYGWQEAGYWHAITRISDLYFMILTVPMSFYFLPRLPRIRTSEALKLEILNGYKYLVPTSILLALNIYLLRYFITTILLTKSFAPIEPLFFWQLLGDIMKIGSWFLSFIILVRSLSRLYIVTELLCGLSLVTFTILFTSKMGTEGAVVAYALTYFLYWIALITIFKVLFKSAKQKI